MKELAFSPTTYSAVARTEGTFVSYTIIPFMDLYTLSVGVDGKATDLGMFRTVHHAAVAGMEHWQEFSERIDAALPGEVVKVPESHHCRTLPKTEIVPAAEMRRAVDAAMEVQHDIGGEA